MARWLQAGNLVAFRADIPSRCIIWRGLNAMYRGDQRESREKVIKVHRPSPNCPVPLLTPLLRILKGLALYPTADNG